MSRGRRAALVLAGVALAGTGALAGLAYLAVANSDRLLGAVGHALGREVRAERLGISFRGDVGVTASGVTIADEPGAEAGQPLLAARSFALRLRLLPLLARRVVVDQVVIDEPVVNLVRGPGGRLNVDSLSQSAPAGGPPTAAEPAPARAPGSAAPAIQLAALRLRHGTIHYRDRDSGRSFELTQVAIEAREPHFGGPVPISLRAQIAGSDLRLENIASDGVLDLSGEQPTYQGTMRAGPGALGELALARVEAAVRAKPPVVALESATVAVLGGTLRGHGQLASGGDGPGLMAVVDGTDLDLTKLPARANRPHAEGRLALHAEITGPPPGSPGFQAALTGSGRFDVTDGRVVGPALGRTLRDVLAPLLGSEAAARLRDRYPDLFAGDELRFTRLTGSGRLAGGRIASDDLVLAGPSYEARGAGTFGLDGNVDLSLRLAASPALTDDLLGRSRARPVLVDERGRLTIPLRVRGPLAHPHVTPEPEFAATVARSLLGGSGLGEAAGSLLEKLLGSKHGRR